jgi:hypothetical protein
MAVIPARRRLRQEYHKFKASLCYIVSPCQKERKGRKEQRRGNEERPLLIFPDTILAK